MSAVDDIKARLDIVDVVSGYAPLKKAGRNYKANCPFHSEKTPSFFVFPDTQTWRCFGQCGEGGDLFSFVMKAEGWDFTEALQELARRAGVELKPRENPKQEAAENRLYDLLAITAEFFSDQLSGSPAHRYLKQRGLTDETAQLFGLGYALNQWHAAHDHLKVLGFTDEEIIKAGVCIRNEQGRVYDRFRHRFIIPIRDSRGRTIGFGARAINPDDEPKYLNSPQSELFDKSHTLFAFDMARRTIRETETVVVVEGYMDVIQAHQAGFTNVVATMGTALTDSHMQTLSKYAHRLVLALDADIAGIKATMRGLDIARETLSSDRVMVLDAQGIMQQAGKLNLDIRVLEIPEGKDPDDFIRQSPEHWQPQVDSALPLAEYIIKAGTANLPPNASVAEREALARELLPLLTATENNLHQRNNVQLLSHRLKLDPKSMVAWAVNRTQQGTPKTGSRGKMAEQKKLSEAPPMVMSLKGRRLEQYCLSVLIREPHRLFEANRLLRQISEKTGGAVVPKLELPDFSQGDFQMIFGLLEDACLQDEKDPLDYLLQNVNDSLQSAIDEVLPEPLETFARKKRLYTTELNSVQLEQKRRHSALRDDFQEQVLRMRLERIEEKIRETYFLQEEEGETVIVTAAHAQLMRTKYILNQAIKEVQMNGKEG
ncbi:MAG: DNA primase [Anaerolineae bacterium]|nr:MAG: DNA primase [Anaerolineae bacterium]